MTAPSDSPQPRPSHPAGRFAPSPSGDLHIGNLRTAVLAWLFARSSGRRFFLRFEDLDRVSPGAQESHLADLQALGIGIDGGITQQSQRLPLYEHAINTLISAGLTYECYCSRKEIQQSASAPHGPDGSYPGTCRTLSSTQQQSKRKAGRAPALRLRSHTPQFTINDYFRGEHTGIVDDFVLRRNDGIPAYNLAVVVDDAEQGIDQVVRGDDLLSSTPRQAYLATLLGYSAPTYVHVPLALNNTGDRLAKRDGSVTLSDLAAQGCSAQEALGLMAVSLNLASPSEKVSMSTLLERFNPHQLPQHPWYFLADNDHSNLM
ncbi:MAG: tRNA glutamyl-Q(34) synthetase GluQRS [Mycobacteriaceae bacterium]